VANLEGAVGSACEPGKTPCFATKAAILDLLTGFDLVSLQNNHSLDTGSEGLHRTAAELRHRHITSLAGKEFSRVMNTSKGRVAIVSATDVVNGRGEKDDLVAADAPALLAEISRLKKTATLVAVYVHWGRELVAAPTERMKELARKYVAAGADVVAGTHPHVPGGAACVDGKPVVWSLGNFLFDQKYDSTKQGALLDCDVVDRKLSCRMTPHETPHGSYLPAYSASDSYREANNILAGCTPSVTPTWSGKFSRDRREKRLVMTPDGAEGMSRLELYDVKTGRREARTPAMPIRKVQTVDLNGDSILEVMLIQDIYSSLDREVAKRVYLYSFDGGFHALWRGSALSRPLLDAEFAASAGKRPLLVALHTDDTFLKRKRQTPGRVVMSYRWNGFGFTGNKDLKGSESCGSLSCSRGKVRLVRQGTVDKEFPMKELR
jgi:poly-gamma-glutamate synthesis protein (capsule biosynthesis protein)